MCTSYLPSPSIITMISVLVNQALALDIVPLTIGTWVAVLHIMLISEAQ